MHRHHACREYLQLDAAPHGPHHRAQLGSRALRKQQVEDRIRDQISLLHQELPPLAPEPASLDGAGAGFAAGLELRGFGAGDLADDEDDDADAGSPGNRPYGLLLAEYGWQTLSFDLAVGCGSLTCHMEECHEEDA